MRPGYDDRYGHAILTIDRIVVRGASEHNLKSVDVDIPRGALTVVTGVSGSGKSSLAFDTICAEGRRRYLETFSSYARQFLGKLSRPAVAGIDGLSPAVAVDQSTLARQPALHRRHDDGAVRPAAPAVGAGRDGPGRRRDPEAGAPPVLVQLAARRLPRLPGPRCRGSARSRAADRASRQEPSARARFASPRRRAT